MTSTHDIKRFWGGAGLVGVVGVIVALALGAAYISISSDQRPRDLPVAAVGPAEAAKALEAKAPGELSVRPVPGRAAARQAIGERDVYGAVVLSREGVRELLIAPAANLSVSNTLRKTLGQPTSGNVPRLTDVGPLPDEDSGGLDVGLLVQILLLGGTVAVVGFGRFVPRFRGDPRRGVLPLASLAGYSLLFGLALALMTEAFGVGTEAAFLERFLALSLISSAVAVSTAALVALIGPMGSAAAGVLYFLLGAQISGAGAAPEFLPPFWSDLGQALPAGAGTSLLRSVFYFPDSSTGESIAILAAYAGIGLAVLLVLNVVHARRRSVAAAAPVPA